MPLNRKVVGLLFCEAFISRLVSLSLKSLVISFLSVQVIVYKLNKIGITKDSKKVL